MNDNVARYSILDRDNNCQIRNLGYYCYEIGRKSMNTSDDSKTGNDNETALVQVSLLKKETIDEIARSVLDILEERESKIKKFLDNLSKYWSLGPIFVIILASLIYGPSIIFYPFKKIAIAHQQLNRQEEKFDFEKNMSEHFIKLGENLLNVGKYQDAAQAYSEAIKLDGDNIEASFGLHKSNLLTKSEAKQFDAEVIAKRINIVLQYRKNDSHAFAAKANLCFHTGNKEEARKLWLDALAENDQLAEAHFGLAVLYIKEGQFPEAIETLEEAKKIAPYKWEYLNNLTDALRYNGEYERAVEIYQKLWLLDLDALSPLIGFANALLMLGQLKNPLNVQDELIRGLENPELIKLEKNKGTWLFRVNGKEIALYSNKVKRVYAYRFRAFIHFMLGNKERAKQDFKVDNSLFDQENSVVNELLAYDLQTLQEEQPGSTNRIKEFRQAYFNKSKDD